MLTRGVGYAPPGVLASLVRDVDLLCLDAGNTLVFLDHARVASICARAGFATTAEALRAAEGRAKIALEEGTALHVAWSRAHVAASRGWAGYLGTLVAAAGLAPALVPAALEALWPEHEAKNLFSLVPEELPPALGRARAAGMRVAVVSNSEGKLEALLEDVGLRPVLDLVVDSARVGVEKPDPRIFGVALERFGVPPARALHVGDLYATDVVGARAAGMRVALVDPFGHLRGRHPDVARVSGVAEVAEALARALGPP